MKMFFVIVLVLVLSSFAGGACLINGGFENSDLTGWTYWSTGWDDAATVIDDGTACEGIYYVRLSLFTVDSFAYSELSQTSCPAVADEVYELTVCCRNVSGGGYPYLEMRFLDGGNNPIETAEDYPFVPVGTGWQVVTLQGIAPAGTAKIIIYLAALAEDPATSFEIDYDDVSLRIIQNPPPCVPPPANMVAWWPLDETVGNTSEDLVGDNDGTWINSPTAATGMVDGALNINGTSYVRVTDDPAIDFGEGNFSIDCWIRTTTTDRTLILGKRAGTTASPIGYVLYLTNGALTLQLGDGSGGYRTYASTQSVADGLWHHVAATVNRGDANGIVLYVGGAPVGVFSTTNIPGNLNNNADLWFGRDRFGIGSSLTGDIDEVEFFKRALDEIEIRAIFDAGAEGKCKFQGCFTRYYPLGSRQHNLWITLGEPDCWCYDIHQCGDVDGDCYVTIASDIMPMVIARNGGAAAYDPCADANYDGFVTIASDIMTAINHRVPATPPHLADGADCLDGSCLTATGGEVDLVCDPYATEPVEALRDGNDD